MVASEQVERMNPVEAPVRSVEEEEMRDDEDHREEVEEKIISTEIGANVYVVRWRLTLLLFPV